MKSGRTHLMDATPVTLGQEFGGYAAAVEHGVERLEAVPAPGRRATARRDGRRDRVERPGGLCTQGDRSAGAGTGPAAHRGPRPLRGTGLRGRPRRGLRERSERSRSRSTSSRNDLRWMSSGPRCGLGEIHLPDLQPGSSIMPGKVNPVVPEAVCQVVAQVVGNDAAVAFGAPRATSSST